MLLFEGEDSWSGRTHKHTSRGRQVTHQAQVNQDAEKSDFHEKIGRRVKLDMTQGSV